MDLKDYVRNLTPKQRDAFAKRAGTSTAYLAQLAGNHRKPSPDMARRLVKASRHELSLVALRPDIWSEVA